MPETKCNVCEKNLILDEENICAQCELCNDIGKNIETQNNVNCGTCSVIVEENSEGLHCDVCDRWYHNACSENPLIEYLYCLLNEAPNNVKWFCDKCIWETEKWIKSLKEGINNNEESDAIDINETDLGDEDVSDIEIEKNLNVRQRDRPRRLNEDENSFKTGLESDPKYDHTKEPEVIIDESQSTDSKDYDEKLIAKKIKRHGSKKKARRHNKRSVPCDMCSKRFLKVEDLVAHKLLHSGDKKPFKCTDCDCSFSLKGTLKRHSITHDDGKPFFCDICAKSFKWKSAFMRHLKEIHSDDKLHQCSLCEFKATNQSRFDAHMRKHSNIRPFKCTECEYSGKTSHTLIAHMITHSSEKPYVCLECNKAFKKADRLKAHMYIHTGAWPFECSICGAKFAEESGLVIHVRMHTGERPYACTICDHRFSQQGALNRHMWVHSGIKPFACDICGKNFRHESHVKTHKLIHTGEKPLKCELCGKKFRASGTLRRHMIYHSKTMNQTFEKPYECDKCGNKYKTLGSLNRHKRGTRGSCQGANGTGNFSKHPILVKNTQNEQKPELASLTDQEPVTNRFSVKPFSEQAHMKSTSKPFSEQAHIKPKDKLNPQQNQEPTSSMHSITSPQSYQNPPSLLYPGATNNYSQYHGMLMNATSTQWAQNAKFWN